MVNGMLLLQQQYSIVVMPCQLTGHRKLMSCHLAKLKSRVVTVTVTTLS